MQTFRNRCLLVLLVFGVTVAGGVYLYHHSPTEGVGKYPLCVFRQVANIDCAGCGLTRASHELVHLRIASAISYNPLVVLALPFIFYWVGTELGAWVWRERYRGPRVRISQRGAFWMLIVVLLYTVLRNIPVWPLTMLSPGGG